MKSGRHMPEKCDLSGQLGEGFYAISACTLLKTEDSPLVEKEIWEGNRHSFTVICSYL